MVKVNNTEGFVSRVSEPSFKSSFKIKNMPKTFDCEKEPNEFMDMPCMCDCGNWFDLNDGHNSRHSNKIICRECKENEICKKCGNEGWIYLKEWRR